MFIRRITRQQQHAFPASTCPAHRSRCRPWRGVCWCTSRPLRWRCVVLVDNLGAGTLHFWRAFFLSFEELFINIAHEVRSIPSSMSCHLSSFIDSNEGFLHLSYHLSFHYFMMVKSVNAFYRQGSSFVVIL